MDPLLLCGIFVRVSFRYLYTVCASWETLEIRSRSHHSPQDEYFEEVDCLGQGA